MLALVFNRRRTEDAILRRIDESLSPATGPRWRRVTGRPPSTPARSSSWSRPAAFDNAQILDGDGLVDRFSSVSFVAASPEQQRAELYAAMGELAAGTSVTLRYHTELEVLKTALPWTCRMRIPSPTRLVSGLTRVVSAPVHTDGFGFVLDLTDADPAVSFTPRDGVGCGGSLLRQAGSLARRSVLPAASRQICGHGARLLCSRDAGVADMRRMSAPCARESRLSPAETSEVTARRVADTRC